MSQFTAEQQAILDKARARRGSGSQKGRMALQGLTLGFAEELEAGVKAAFFDDRPYEEIRDEIRQKIDRYQQQNPGEALTYELLGGIAPTALALLTGAGAPAAAANVSRMGLGQMFKRGAGEGLIAGTGYSQGETPEEVLTDAAVGGVTGAIASPIIGKVADKALGSLSGFQTFVRSTLGDRASNAAVAELQRLAEGAGGVDAVLDGLRSGQIMAENRTLAAAVRAIKSKDPQLTGGAGKRIDETLRTRADENIGKAVDTASQALNPNASVANVFQDFDLTDKAMKALEKSGYRMVFNQHPQLDDSMQSVMDRLMEQYPDIANTLNKFYMEQGQGMPLFIRGSDGVIQQSRPFSLQDAEVMYRMLRDEAQSRFDAGNTTGAVPLSDRAQALKKLLDSKFPDLKETRKVAAKRRSSADAFKEGRKALGMDADELQFAFEGMTEEAKEQFRRGALAAIKNRIRRSPGSASRFADPSRQEGSVLKIIARPEDFDDLRQSFENAGLSGEAVNRILYNSMTAPEASATKAIGSGQMSAEALTSAFAGNPLAIAQIVGGMIQKTAPDLSPKDYKKVTETLLSDDPEFVKRVLNDEVSFGQLQKRITEILGRAAADIRRTGTGVAAGASAETFGPLLDNLAKD